MNLMNFSFDEFFFSAADAAVNCCWNQTNSANCLITFLIENNPVFSNGP